jgi:hypothetical protein
VDAEGNAYITGSATSANFPTTSGAYQTKLTSMQDAFVAKLNPDGSQLLYSTLLGSQAALPAYIAVDSTGEAVITGITSSNYPVTPNAFQPVPVAGCKVQFPFASFVISVMRLTSAALVMTP